MRPRLHVTFATVALLTGASMAVTAAAAQRSDRGSQAPPAPETENPCLGPEGARLRCPDLRMGKPADMYAEQTARGRVVLRATNNVKNRGKGPVAFRGRRTDRDEMSARQHIYRVDGSRLIVKTGAELYWKYIPGQGHYWKFRDAARFELWSVDHTGHRKQLVRTGPKVYYCLRDLRRTAPSKRSPRFPKYPACNQDSHKRSVTLGTSVGWSDIYPSTYHQQWIDVSGLHGCFAYVHRADPKNHIWESNEGNNDAQRIVRLPWRGSRAKNCS
jgi:Lysyl oxidase